MGYCPVAYMGLYGDYIGYVRASIGIIRGIS